MPRIAPARAGKILIAGSDCAKVLTDSGFPGSPKFFNHSQSVRIYDDAGNVIETREHAGELKEP
jgi:hypothetical protein